PRVSPGHRPAPGPRARPAGGVRLPHLVRVRSVRRGRLRRTAGAPASHRGMVLRRARGGDPPGPLIPTATSPIAPLLTGPLCALPPLTAARPGSGGGYGEFSPQLTAFFTSAPILASSAAVNSVRAKAFGHMLPSSRFALSLKPSVAYLVLNFCPLWKKQTPLPSLAYAHLQYQSIAARPGA